MPCLAQPAAQAVSKVLSGPLPEVIVNAETTDISEFDEVYEPPELEIAEVELLESSYETRPFVPSSLQAVLKLGYQDFLEQILRDNDQIQSGRYQWGIASTAVTNAQGEFQTTVEGSIGRDSNFTRNTVEEALSRSSLAAFPRRDTPYNLRFRKQS